MSFEEIVILEGGTGEELDLVVAIAFVPLEEEEAMPWLVPTPWELTAALVEGLIVEEAAEGEDEGVPLDPWLGDGCVEGPGVEGLVTVTAGDITGLEPVVEGEAVVEGIEEVLEDTGFVVVTDDAIDVEISSLVGVAGPT